MYIEPGKKQDRILHEKPVENPAFLGTIWAEKKTSSRRCGKTPEGVASFGELYRDIPSAVEDAEDIHGLGVCIYSIEYQIITNYHLSDTPAVPGFIVHERMTQREFVQRLNSIVDREKQIGGCIRLQKDLRNIVIDIVESIAF